MHKPPLISVYERHDLVKTAKFPHATFPFEKFNPVQSALIDVYDKEANCIVATSTSSGKAQPLWSKILTPNGFINMSQCHIGTKIIGSDGKTYKVTGVFPQGIKKIFKVVFSDGSFTHCCEDHLWSVRTRFDKHRKIPFITLPLKSIISDLKFKNGQHKWHIPLMSIDIKEKFNNDFELHPYLLGLLLGDGGIKHHTIISSSDNFIIDKFKEFLPDVTIKHLKDYDFQLSGGMEVSKTQKGKKGFQKTNYIKQQLVKLGLFGLGSCEKFVPQKYLNGTHAERIALLRGLMDTDGNANGKHQAAEYSSCSLKLAEAVRDLARSFGASTKIREGATSYVNTDGERVWCEKRHRVTVNIGNINPFLLPHKAKKQGLGLEKGRNRYIESIEFIGEDECQCISVNSPDNLYVTDDYILTHNTVCAEMFMSHEVRVRGNKAVYLSPLKSLSQEKLDDWLEEHHFSDLNVAIQTGDYRTSKGDLDKADIVIMTCEMLNSVGRNINSDKNKWLKKVGLVVADEFHTIGEDGRGDHLECGIIKLSGANPDCRWLMLSATMTNVGEAGKWLHHLTGRSTYLLESTYRPCKLNIHYEKYLDNAFGYDENEQRKIHIATELVKKHAHDKFICFVHTKKTGELLLARLTAAGVRCDYHNANLAKEKRVKIEKQFREDPDLRVIVATSGLSAGLNMPARRVVILGVHSGLREVETQKIMQMAGRGGRPQYDPEGDAHILLPQRRFDEHVKRLKEPIYIQSQMANPKVLAFHLVSEIHHGTIKCLDDVYDWYGLTLAHFQKKKLDDATVEQVMKNLIYSGCVRDEDGNYTVTPIGMIASMFYYSPFDVADLNKNFNKLFDVQMADHDYWLSMALANTDSHRMGIANSAEKAEMDEFFKEVGGSKIEKTLSPKQAFTPGILKAGYCYWMLLNGKNSANLNSLMKNLQMDFGRAGEVLNALDSMSSKWGESKFFKRLGLRMTYGVPEELVELCQLKNIGKVKAQRLYSAGLRDIKDCTDQVKVIKALGCSAKVAGELVSNAKTLLSE